MFRLLQQIIIMAIQVPNFTNSMLNRVAQGDMSILDEEHDFTHTEYAKYQNWNALIVASVMGYLNLVNRLLGIDTVRVNATARNNDVLGWAAGYGQLVVVNRLLEIAEVRANAAANDNEALRWTAANGHLEVVNRLLEIDAVIENATARDNYALTWAAANGHLKVVNRLLKINAVRANAAAMNNGALLLAAQNGHSEVVHTLAKINEVRANAGARDNYALVLLAADGHSEVVHTLAKAQWPLGKQDMPEEMQQYLPLIKAGAQLYTAKREQERILISALQNKPVLSTNSLYATYRLGDDPRASWLFNLPGDVVDSIANYVGYEGQSLAEQIQKDDWQNAWNDMRRSERLYGLFTNTNTSRTEEGQALAVYKP